MFPAAVVLAAPTLGQHDNIHRAAEKYRPLRLEHASPFTKSWVVADEECCGRLADINFSSNLPVVIVDTYGVGLTRDKVNASLCTCSTLSKGDYNGEVQVSLRGGDNTRKGLSVVWTIPRFPHSCSTHVAWPAQAA